MIRPVALAAVVALAAAAVLPLAAQEAQPRTLAQAQAQLRQALAQAKKDAADAAKARAAAARPAARLSCVPVKPSAAGADSVSGLLDLGSLSLDNSRSRSASPLIAQADESRVVDERCGSLMSPLKDNLNYEVTPAHYWGQDILQLPKSALGSGGKPFQAFLHECQYDGDWHASWDIALTCTLAR